MRAEPCATKDLDILVGADAENSKAVYAALAKFCTPVEGLTALGHTPLVRSILVPFDLLLETGR
jgi:hypothetical protein